MKKIAVLFLLVIFAMPFFCQKILFDATKHEMAGNADWVIDSDYWNLNMPAYPCSGSSNEANPASLPTPDQSTVSQSTPETYWTGAISAWAIELVKAGYIVETLPPTGYISFGDVNNPQDLSNYKVFIMCEPQNQLSASEKTAILNFVSSGGGLFMVADHETSDRDCDNWDSPHIFNDLTQAVSTTQTGLFGIWFRVNEISDKGGEDWFDDATDNNIETDPNDPIICGPFGSGSGGLGLFGATSMDINPLDNPYVKAHVWRTGQSHNNLRVTFATSQYGDGRIAAIGDSSPADDGTGDSGDTLYDGWDKASGGVNNKEIFMNATYFLLNPAPDTTPPSITEGPSSQVKDCSAVVSWKTDEAANSIVEYGLTDSYGMSVSSQSFVKDHLIDISSLNPSTQYHYRVLSSDTKGNGPTASSDLTFTTSADSPPVIVTGPSVVSVSSSTAKIVWESDEPATSLVEYGTSQSYGNNAYLSGYSKIHEIVISGLTPETTYHFRVVSSDECGNGPTYSGDSTFVTSSPAHDISGWTIKQYNSSQSFTFPQGTFIPQNGYLILARNVTRSQFESQWPSMPAETGFVNSNPNGSCPDGCFPMINGSEIFELYDSQNNLIDGPTISISASNSYQRKNPSDDPSLSASWNTLSQTSATPGSGAGNLSGAGVVINEMADNSSFSYEFIELFNDGGSSVPDTIAPEKVSDLAVIPDTNNSLKLEWTAPGDDGMSGTATSYEIRYSLSPIKNDNDFNSATLVASPPSPVAGGTKQTFIVSELTNSEVYFFALKTSDEVPNQSALSNCAWALVQDGGSQSNPVNHLLISQIRVSGSTDDVVELFNPTTSSISLSGYSIQYFAANSNFGFRVNLNASKSVPALGWYLIAGNGYSGSPAADDSLGTANASSTAGHLALVQSTSNSSCSASNIVDKVGYGTSASCPETSPATLPASGNSIKRKPDDTTGNGQDTDNNQNDFLSPSAPSFRNSSSTPATLPQNLGVVGKTLFLSKEGSQTLLEWGRAAGASEYHIYSGASPDFMNNPPSPIIQTANSAINSEIPSPVLYFVVLAGNGSDESED